MKKRHILLSGILVCALGLRLYRLNWTILICDELSSVLWWMDLNFLGKLIRSATIEPNPPLYFIILHTWIKLFGGTELSIRLLSVLMGLSSIILLYLIGKELIDVRAGIGGALLMAVSPYHLFYTTYARMYALLLFLVLLSYYFFIKLLKEGRRKWLWCYVLSTALSLYTHYSALYAVLVQNIYFLIFWKDYRKLTHLWIKALLGVIICFLPWLPVFLKDLFFSQWSLKTITPVAFPERILAIKRIFIYNFMPYIGETYFDFSIGDLCRWRLLKWINPLMSAAISIFFISGMAYLFKDKKRFAFISLYLFTFFFFLLFIPRYNRPRFFVQICPAFYLIVACGILRYKDKIKALSIGIVLLFHLIALNIYYAQIKISPVKSAFAYLKTTYQKGDIILINSCDVRNWGTNFWYHNRYQNNASFDIRLLKIPGKMKSIPLANKMRDSDSYERFKRHFRPLLGKLKVASGYRNVEDIYEVININNLYKGKRVWYVGDENRSLLGKNKEVIALLENKSFTLTAYRDFDRTRLYLLQK